MDVYKKLKTNKKNRSTRRVLLFFVSIEFYIFAI